MVAFSRILATALLASAAPLPLLAPAADAAPVITVVGTSFAIRNGYSFAFQGSSFTFTATGDIFAPAAVSGTGQFNSFFGAPTDYFVGRGTVTFGPNNIYTNFATPTTVSYSNGDNFFGLAATLNGNTYYGYAYTTNTTLNSYAFESVAGTPITATTALATATVPEPAAWSLMILGFGAIGVALRRRRPAVRFA